MNATFPSTDWSQIRIARDFLSADGQPAFSRLIARYMPALRWYLTRERKLSRDEADELLQQFVLDKFIERRLLDQAQKDRGRFRTFLLTVLRRFLIDRLRREANEPGGIDGDLSQMISADESAAFEQAWAEGMIAEALARTCRYLLASGMEGHWKTFNARVVAPAYSGVDAASYDDLCRDGEFASPRQAINALANAKRVFRRELSIVLGEDPRERHEVEDLLQILSRRATAGRPLRT